MNVIYAGYSMTGQIKEDYIFIIVLKEQGEEKCPTSMV